MILLLALQVVQSPLAVRPDTLRPVHDALHYDITLVVSDSGRHILGQVETVWRLGSSEPVAVQLDTAFRVVRVLINGRENTRLSRTMWGRSGGDVVIPHDGKAGDTLTTRIRYHGEASDGLIIGRNGYGDRTIFADNWPDRAHRWFPTPDIPGDKATVAFHVQAPLDYQVVANGVLETIDTLAYGNAVWNYRLDTPIPVYTMVVGIARMARTRLPDAACAVKCVPLSVWSYPQDSAFAVDGPFRRAGDMVEYFSRLIGPFPYPSLANVESSTRFGGMENAGAIFYDENIYRSRGLQEATVAHETAHQWFGDAVTELDWHHLWLSEGFATYLAVLWVGHADGGDAFATEMRKAATTVFQAPVTERPVLDTTSDLKSLLNSNNYSKSAWVLHQLRGMIGDSAFFNGLRRYYAVYRDSTALSSDFARVMSEAAGRDLDWYFRQALTQPGYPMLDIRWRYKGDKLTLDITQAQSPSWGIYRIPALQIRVDGQPYRFDIAERQSQQVIKGIKRRPETIQVDPQGWWLLQSRVNEEPEKEKQKRERGLQRA